MDPRRHSKPGFEVRAAHAQPGAYNERIISADQNRHASPDARDLRAAMDDLMRFPSAVRHEPAIDTWLLERRKDLRSFVETWFAHMRQCGDDVRELMHDGCPTACVDDAAFGYVNAFKDHVNVGFFHGASLKDPARLLEGTGKRMRHVKLRPGRDMDTAALIKLIDAAYADIRARLSK
jgi:hypothetical protein